MRLNKTSAFASKTVVKRRYDQYRAIVHKEREQQSSQGIQQQAQQAEKSSAVVFESASAEAAQVTSCDCNLVQVSSDQPLAWFFCPKCLVSVTQGVCAHCCCGNLEPCTESGNEMDKVDWIDCDRCDRSSHAQCYPGSVDKEKFMCIECRDNTDLVYTCTACGWEACDDAQIRQHIQTGHSAAEHAARAITYRVHF